MSNPRQTRAARVGFIIDTLAPGGGTENQLILLLARFDRRRTVPQLCCLRPSRGLDDLDLGCRTEVLNVRRLASAEGLRGLGRLRRWIRRESLDLVVTFFRDANLIGTLGAWSVGVPVISSRRNLGRGYWHTPFEIFKLRRLNALTRGIVANSEAVARYTAQAEGVPPGRIAIIPNALDTERFRPLREGERARTRAALGYGSDDLLIGCVANLRPIKGHDLLLDAFATLARRLGEARLVLVGDGGERARLHARCIELGIANRVDFLGRRHDTDVLLRALDMTILASRAESLSNAIIESLASGVPVVATDVGGNRELVLEGQTGILVPAGDALAMTGGMLALASDPVLRATLGRRGRDFAVRRFSVPTVLELWDDYFATQKRLLAEATT